MILNIYEDITQQTLQDFSDSISNISEDDCELELNIASYGGEILCTIAMIDLMKSKGLKTTANIVGFAASAAAILALSCDTVTMSSLGSIMIHSAWNELSDDSDPGIKRCNEVQLQIINNRCKLIDKETLKSDHWFNAQQSLELGLIDNIYNNVDEIKACCNKYAAKLLNKEIPEMEENVKEVIEEIKEDAVEEEPKAAEEATEDEEPKKDVVDIVEKLVEELNSLKARVLALENPAAAEDVVEETVAEEDEQQNRINNIYKSIMAPQACISIGAPKAATQDRVVHKVDYKKFASFIND